MSDLEAEWVASANLARPSEETEPGNNAGTRPEVVYPRAPEAPSNLELEWTCHVILAASRMKTWAK